MKKNLLTIIDLLIIAAVAIYISLMAGFWSGYPMGTDAYTHLFKVKFLLENWPNTDWNNLWSGGMPMFLWYSIIPYLGMAVVKIITGSYELSAQLCSMGAIIVIVWSIYLTVKTVTNNRLAAMIAAILATITPALWSKMAMGEIPRLMGTAWMPLAWWVVIVYLLEKNKKRSWQLIILIIVALALCTHYVLTAFVIMTLGVIIYFSKKNMDEVWNSWQKWIMHPAILAIFSLLPFFISSGLKQVFGEGLFGGNVNHPTINLSKFFYEAGNLTNIDSWSQHDYGAALFPVLLPLTIIVLLLAISHRQKQNEMNTEWKIMKAFFYINVFLIIYGTANYFGFPGKFYNAAIPPSDAFYFLAMTLPVLVGLCWPWAVRNKYLQALSTIIILIATAYCANLYYPYKTIKPEISSHYKYYKGEETLDDELNKLITDQTEKMYRFAHNNSFLAVWFNYDFGNISQTRDYYSQAILNGNNKFWFENAVFALKDNYTETKYLLDWWGVKWLAVGFPNYNADKFINKTDWFEPKAKLEKNNLDRLDTFEYKEAKPIYQLTNAKTMLVISDAGTYNNVLLALSQVDLGSDKLIPIQGKQTLDLYTLEELKEYDSILVHNFNYLEKERAFDLMDKYVQGGGKLLVEAAGILSAEGGTTAFPPLPVKKIIPGNFGTQWNLKKENEELLKDVDVNDFGPALYGQDQPWSMLYTDKTELRDGAEAVLSNNDKIVIAKINIGQGEAIWSGLNLFYHLNNYKKPGEARLIENMIVELLDLDNFQPINTVGESINPHLRQATVEKADYTGFLLKENFYNTWKANYDTNGIKRKLDIWKAGPGMMYVRLPKFENKYMIEVSYHKWWFEWAAYGLSLIYLLWLIYTHLIHTIEEPEAEKMAKVLAMENAKKVGTKENKPRVKSTQSLVPSKKMGVNGQKKKNINRKSIKSKNTKPKIVKNEKPKRIK